MHTCSGILLLLHYMLTLPFSYSSPDLTYGWNNRGLCEHCSFHSDIYTSLCFYCYYNYIFSILCFSFYSGIYTSRCFYHTATITIYLVYCCSFPSVSLSSSLLFFVVCSQARGTDWQLGIQHQVARSSPRKMRRVEKIFISFPTIYRSVPSCFSHRSEINCKIITVFGK